MAHFGDKSIFSLYPQLVQWLTSEGEPASPRGKRVVELTQPVTWTLSKPHEWALFIPGRKFNPFFAMAEVVWMWSGKGGGDFIAFYNKSIQQFMDPGIPYFHGSYGKRVRKAGYEEVDFRPNLPSLRMPPGPTGAPAVELDQLQLVIDRLRRDPESRQAVISLWDPAKDNLVVDAKDYPCNNIIYFSIRNNQLNMSVVRRSNDLIWGVPYNICQFSHLQMLVAGSLDVRIGHYTVFANNLHMYLDQAQEARDTVQQWARTTAGATSRTLQNLSESFYRDTKTWDKRLDLVKFDTFVATVWDPLEKRMRLEIEEFQLKRNMNPDSVQVNHTISAFYMTRKVFLEEAFETYTMPPYWCAVFLTLFAYHCRKGGAMDVYHEVVQQLPYFLRWLIQDFTGELLETLS